MAVAQLPLKQYPRAACFRLIDGLIRSQPDLLRVGARVHSWTGQAKDKSPRGTAERVAITLTPIGEDGGWYSPDSAEQPVVIAVDLEVQTDVVDDFLNLWDSIERALYPPDDPTQSPPNLPRLAVVASFNAAGMWSGMVTFRAPGEPEGTDAGRMAGRGFIRYSAYKVLNP